MARRLAAGVALSDPAVVALREATVRQLDTDRWTVTLHTHLDRSDYEQADTALRRLAGGGHYQPRVRVHVYRDDPGPELAAVLATDADPGQRRRDAAELGRKLRRAANLCAMAGAHLENQDHLAKGHPDPLAATNNAR
jgi:hypothetical protein